MDQHDQVVGFKLPSGIISHLVVMADQGPVDGAQREGQQLRSCSGAASPVFQGARWTVQAQKVQCP